MKFNSSAELAVWARGSARLWLFLDYDGTLAEFAPTPAHVEPRPQVVDLLEQLACKPAIRLTIISGRRLPDIRVLVPLDGIFVAGSYGVELLVPGGERIDRAEYSAIRPTLVGIKPQWEQLISGRSGFFLEDKSWTLALHGRLADPEEADKVLGQARELASVNLPENEFRFVGGYKFLEIAPLLARKSEAVTYLLEQFPLPESRLLYIGDDEKDEEAFPVVQAHHGAAVRVLEPKQAAVETAADLCFDSPSATLAWLRQLL
jgi:trehalose 6-phosphate phosphatase